MSEKQKMLCAQYYTPWDETLSTERDHAMTLCHELNQIPASQRDARSAVIAKLLPNADPANWIESPFNCDYGYNITTGKNFYNNINFTAVDGAPITIGDDVLIGPNVSIYTVDHALDPAERRAGYEVARPVTIGNNVWIGGSVTILGGVTIGDNTVIAAGAVVTADVPAGVVAGGVPCRVIKTITEADKQNLPLG